MLLGTSVNEWEGQNMQTDKPAEAVSDQSVADEAATGAEDASAQILSPLTGDDDGTGEKADGDAGEEEKGGTTPDSEEGYEIPEIEGLDADKLKTSPIVESMRAAAFKAGLTQEAFSEAISDYAERAQTQLKDNTQREIASLGENAKQRIAALNATLGQRLPSDLAQSLAASITTAKAVQAIEKLLATGRKTTGSQAQPKPAKSREEIEKMMADPRYRGSLQQRDPTFISEIDAWWRAQAEAKK